MSERYDAVVVGSGPNGLAAGVELARAGRSVLVLEGSETIGGGCRTAELTLPGYRHDVCSAFHPLAIASPFFRSVPLHEHGLELVHPPAPLAHPMDDGPPAVLERSLEDTSSALGSDARAWSRLYAPLTTNAESLVHDLLAPPLRIPRRPLALGRFGVRAIRSADALARGMFSGERARALFAGLAAHSILPLDRPPSASFGLLLGALGQSVGWPVARGGSQAIADALASYLRSLGGEIRTGTWVESIDDLPQARAFLFEVAPRELARIAGRRLSSRSLRALAAYRHGPGAFKVDWALDGPIPWRFPGCERAGTVHLGGTLDEIVAAEGAVARGGHPERPFVLLGQQSLFDATRAPEGRQTAWAYCHVPNGSTVDVTDQIEAQIERFAPGFRDRVLARSVRTPAHFEKENPNYVGGDIVGGLHDLRQLVRRPVLSRSPYSTSAPGIYLCSASTPPGGGVHGMCGYFAARAALRSL